MLWFEAGRRRLLVCLPVLAVCGGCGFQPLFGGTGPGALIQQQLGEIEIATPATGVGDVLHQRLTRAFGGAGSGQGPRGRLEIELALSERDSLIREDAKVTRRSLVLAALYRLKAPDGEILWTGRSLATSSYDRVVSEYANLTARRAARERVIRELAEDMTLRVAGFLHRQGWNAARRAGGRS